MVNTHRGRKGIATLAPAAVSAKPSISQVSTGQEPRAGGSADSSALSRSGPDLGSVMVISVAKRGLDPSYLRQAGGPGWSRNTAKWPFPAT